MKNYTINIRETLETQVTVKATSDSEAIEKAKALYHAGEIVLGADNLMDTEFMEAE